MPEHMIMCDQCANEDHAIIAAGVGEDDGELTVVFRTGTIKTISLPRLRIEYYAHCEPSHDGLSLHVYIDNPEKPTYIIPATIIDAIGTTLHVHKRTYNEEQEQQAEPTE